MPLHSLREIIEYATHKKVVLLLRVPDKPALIAKAQMAKAF